MTNLARYYQKPRATAGLTPAAEQVNESNTLEYARLLAEERVFGAVRVELTLYLAGFHEVVPPQALRDSGVNAVALGAMLAGAVEIDVDDWQHT